MKEIEHKEELAGWRHSQEYRDQKNKAKKRRKAANKNKVKPSSAVGTDYSYKNNNNGKKKTNNNRNRKFNNNNEKNGINKMTMVQLKSALHELGVIRIPPAMCNKAGLVKLYSDLKECGKVYVNIEPINIPGIDDDENENDNDNLDENNNNNSNDSEPTSTATASNAQ